MKRGKKVNEGNNTEYTVVRGKWRKIERERKWETEIVWKKEKQEIIISEENVNKN